MRLVQHAHTLLVLFDRGDTYVCPGQADIRLRAFAPLLAFFIVVDVTIGHLLLRRLPLIAHPGVLKLLDRNWCAYLLV